MKSVHHNIIRRIIGRNVMRPQVAAQLVENYRQENFLPSRPNTRAVVFKGLPVLEEDLKKAMEDRQIFDEEDLSVWHFMPAYYIRPQNCGWLNA